MLALFLFQEHGERREIRVNPSVVDKLRHGWLRPFSGAFHVHPMARSIPNADQLHASHEALVQSLAKFRAELGESWTPDAGAQFASFLRDWLVQHVIKEDLPMKPWMTKFSPRFDPRA